MIGFEIMGVALAFLAFGGWAAVAFWPDTEGWHPLARDDRREGYADGMGGKRPQLGRSGTYRAAWVMGLDDCERLRGRAA